MIPYNTSNHSKQTSLDAYKDIQTDSTAASQRIKILHFLKRYPNGLLRSEISSFMGIPINSVCGRVRELLDFNTAFEEGKRINTTTNKYNLVVKAR